MTIIITTTGISLYNFTRRKYPSPTEEQMRQSLYTDAKNASAEVNSLLQIAEPDDTIVLLYTKNLQANTCAKLVKDFFVHEGYKHIRLVELNFQDDEKQIETVGIRSFVNTLIKEIDNAQKAGQKVVINATSGLKAQVVYSTMIGMLYHVPVKYMYEGFQRVVTFNPIALDWDTSLFLSYEPFFTWLEAELRTPQQVERYLNQIPSPDQERIRELLAPPDEDNFVLLSFMGEALRKRFERQILEAENTDWPSEVKGISIDDKIVSSLLLSRHHPIKKLLQLARKIAELPYIQKIEGGFFENTTLSRIKSANDDGKIHLLWADDEKAQNLIISTTAKDKLQTLKVANKIKEIMRDL